MARHQGFQHELAGKTEHVAQHVPDLHVGVFQYLLHTIPFLGSSPDHLLAAPRQVPQFALRPRRNKARTNHSVTQQVRQPARIVRVGLVPGDGLDLLRIGQHYL